MSGGIPPPRAESEGGNHRRGASHYVQGTPRRDTKRLGRFEWNGRVWPPLILPESGSKSPSWPKSVTSVYVTNTDPQPDTERI